MDTLVLTCNAPASQYDQKLNNAARRVAASFNFGVKLMWPDFDPVAELPMTFASVTADAVRHSVLRKTDRTAYTKDIRQTEQNGVRFSTQ